MTYHCERPGCNGKQAELSRIGGITRRMCWTCTKEMVLKQREKENGTGGMFK